MDEPKGEKWKHSSISNKFPSYRNKVLITTHSWLNGKRKDDNAEGLWRIHDVLYDFTDFIDKHPGGPSWLQETKGTDITEAFEAHHISLGPEKLLHKYKVRNAKEPRNITLTFKENGFYKTLKKRVGEKLQTIDNYPKTRSDMIHTSILIATFLTGTASALTGSNLLGVVTGVFICWTAIIAHNYFHRRDNWRMYTFNLSLMNFRDWRISHALSHHLYPNSFHDLELSMFEPFFCWIPNPYIKNWIQRYLSWLYGPVLYAATFVFQIARRFVYSIVISNIIRWDDFIPFSLPLVMYILGGKDVVETFRLWLIMELVGGFSFALIGLNAAHHHPDIHHDGDAMREDKDWGLFQLDTIADRKDIKGSQFLVLTHFGDHALHHLFPTLDHGILSQLYPVLFQTMNEFKGQLRDYNWIDHIIGQHQQLARITPNRIPPGSDL